MNKYIRGKIFFALLAIFLLPLPARANITITRFSGNISPDVHAGDPVTFTAETSASVDETVYYLFGFKPKYGTAEYETAHWIKIQDWSVNNSCTFSFSEAGKYVITAEASNTPGYAADTPIMGGVVTVNEPETIALTGLHNEIAENPWMGDPVTIKAEGISSPGASIYYRFQYKPAHGTKNDASAPWVILQDWSKTGACTHAFAASGNYIVIVEASDMPDEPIARIHPMMGESLSVKDPAQADGYTNSLGMGFKRIKAGTFLMGSPATEPGRDRDEVLHLVTLTQPFYMQSTEVTQGEWVAVMGSNPSYYSSCGTTCPVEEVSWDDAQAFIQVLNKRGRGTYRLPSEAEWEYAARAGSLTAFANGDSGTATVDPALDLIGWYAENSGGATHPVAQKIPNAWGLHDMHGNVWEWCQDWYGSYAATSQVDPAGPDAGSAHVVRSGSWHYAKQYCRSANRGGNFIPTFKAFGLGFRLIWTPGLVG